ncbi:MAG: hypothetical protein V2J24_10200 [Pseudomonadales bacterium]|jgi:hypothetical protein|nr:hypothetical protein [Pseudomonadales bacterium]
MIRFAGRRNLFGMLLLWGALGVTHVGAAPNFPERYIDPDDLLPDETEVSDAVWPGGLGAFDDRPYDVYDGVGVVDAVDPAGPSVVIDGLRYDFVLTPEIRLRAGVGAPTLLGAGMVLEYYYTQDGATAATAGRIVAAIELDPDAREEE